MMKFTIAIPAYKKEYLEEAIRSVLAQSFTDFELLILDDDSPNDLQSIVGKFNDKRIRYYRNGRNVGALNVVKNWNKCLDLAEGEYIICMGDDDCLCPDALTEYARYIDMYPDCDLFHGATEMINEESELINIQEARPDCESVYSMAWHRLTRKREQFIGDFLFSTKALKEVGGFYDLPLAWASDDISALRVAMKNGVVNLSEIVFRYRVNRINITSTGNVHHKLAAIELEKKWYRENLLSDSPLSETDARYRHLINLHMEGCFRRKIISTCAEGFKSSFFSMLWNIRRYDLCFKDVCIAVLLGLARKAGVSR